MAFVLVVMAQSVFGGADSRRTIPSSMRSTLRSSRIASTVSAGCSFTYIELTCEPTSSLKLSVPALAFLRRLRLPVGHSFELAPYSPISLDPNLTPCRLRSWRLLWPRHDARPLFRRRLFSHSPLRYVPLGASAFRYSSTCHLGALIRSFHFLRSL